MLGGLGGQRARLNKVSEERSHLEKERFEQTLAFWFHCHTVRREQRLREVAHVPTVTQREQEDFCWLHHILSPHRGDLKGLGTNTGTRTL